MDFYDAFDNPFGEHDVLTNALPNHVQRVVLVAGDTSEKDRVDIEFTTDGENVQTYTEGVDSFRTSHPDVSFDDAFVSIKVAGSKLDPEAIKGYVADSDDFIEQYESVRFSDRPDAKLYTIESAMRDVAKTYRESDAVFDIGPMEQIGGVGDMALDEIPVLQPQRADFERRMISLYEQTENSLSVEAEKSDKIVAAYFYEEDDLVDLSDEFGDMSIDEIMEHTTSFLNQSDSESYVAGDNSTIFQTEPVEKPFGSYFETTKEELAKMIAEREAAKQNGEQKRIPSAAEKAIMAKFSDVVDDGPTIEHDCSYKI